MSEVTEFIELGRSLLEQGLYGLALDVLDKAIKLEPENYKAYEKRAHIHFMSAEWEEAIADLTRIIELIQDPHDDDTALEGAYCNRGTCYLELSQYEKALEDHNRAIELNAGVAKFYYNRGLVHFHRGNTDEALIDYYIAFILNDDRELDSEILNYRGKALLKLNRNDAAFWNFHAATIYDPENVEAFDNMLISNQECSKQPAIENQNTQQKDNLRSLADAVAFELDPAGYVVPDQRNVEYTHSKALILLLIDSIEHEFNFSNYISS